MLHAFILSVMVLLHEYWKNTLNPGDHEEPKDSSYVDHQQYQTLKNLLEIVKIRCATLGCRPNVSCKTSGDLKVDTGDHQLIQPTHQLFRLG